MSRMKNLVVTMLIASLASFADAKGFDIYGIDIEPAEGAFTITVTDVDACGNDIEIVAVSQSGQRYVRPVNCSDPINTFQLPVSSFGYTLGVRDRDTTMLLNSPRFTSDETLFTATEIQAIRGSMVSIGSQAFLSRSYELVADSSDEVKQLFARMSVLMMEQSSQQGFEPAFTTLIDGLDRNRLDWPGNSEPIDIDVILIQASDAGSIQYNKVIAVEIADAFNHVATQSLLDMRRNIDALLESPEAPKPLN